jgi:hypothetical protein
MAASYAAAWATGRVLRKPPTSARGGAYHILLVNCSQGMKLNDLCTFAKTRAM